MIIDILRPDATVVNSGWTLTGGATAQAILSDNSDASYIEGDPADSIRLGFPAHTPAANHERHRVRHRVRLRWASGIPAWVNLYSTLTGALGSYGVTAGTTITDYSSAWLTNGMAPFNIFLHTPGAADPGDQRWTVQAGSDVGDMRLMEVYMDIDCRAQPTFTPDVLDGAGASQDGGIVSDTNAPTIAFGAVDYDELNARAWTLTVFSVTTSTVVYVESGIGIPPSSIRLPTLDNGDYTANLQVESTVRLNDPFESDVETLSWEQDFTPPVPPVGTATVDGCSADGPNVLVSWTQDTPGVQDWDDPDEVAIEIVRVDCNGEQTVYVDGFVPDGSFCDRTMSINEPGFYCGERATQGLRLIGSGNGRIQTPDSVPLSVIGDIEIEADIAIDWQSEFKSRVVRKSGSFAVDIGNWEQGTKRIIFLWVDSAVSVSVRSTEGIPMEYMERAKIKVTHDVNDGAGSRITRFYIDRGYGFVELGDPVVFGTAGDIDDTANAVEFGSASTPQSPRGYFYELTIRNGIGGTVVASPDLTDTSQGWIIGDDVGDTGTDGQGNVWTISGFAGPSVQLESCLVSYRLRFWGLVAGIIVSTDWEFLEAEVVENPEPGNDWLHGINEGDLSVCPDRGYPMSRPFGAFQPIGGGLPTVVTGAPGGRDYALSVAVTSEADQKLLEAILGQALVYYHPAGADSLWLAPRVQQTQVVKVGRIRTTSVDLVAVNPQPEPDPESFF